MKNICSSILTILILLTISSCKKVAGEGGKSSISGKVYVKNYNANFTQLNSEYYGADEDVYIIYGSEISYGNKIKTNYDGVYEFKFLRNGAYKIYIYSKDSTMKSKSGNLAVVSNVEIVNNKNVTVPDILIYK